ncbi:MAG TPA: FmdB family zinc ribbon protein [Candidatus Polarisedimenticolia bacterium]|nr:FmdB family zinc ribbon protein [Candidatus Polarisedimenticolia bacterium]
MPLYEYECTRCGKRVEVIQKFSDPALTRCSACKGALRKLLSAPAIQFKGSGWYVTDYGGKSSGGEKPGKEPASKEPSSPESKSEPAGKSGRKKKDSSS